MVNRDSLPSPLSLAVLNLTSISIFFIFISSYLFFFYSEMKRLEWDLIQKAESINDVSFLTYISDNTRKKAVVKNRDDLLVTSMCISRLLIKDLESPSNDYLSNGILPSHLDKDTICTIPKNRIEQATMALGFLGDIVTQYPFPNTVEKRASGTYLPEYRHISFHDLAEAEKWIDEMSFTINQLNLISSFFIRFNNEQRFAEKIINELRLETIKDGSITLSPGFDPIEVLKRFFENFVQCKKIYFDVTNQSRRIQSFKSSLVPIKTVLGIFFLLFLAYIIGVIFPLFLKKPSKLKLIVLTVPIHLLLVAVLAYFLHKLLSTI
jgi:hypothetical protein